MLNRICKYLIGKIEEKLREGLSPWNDNIARDEWEYIEQEVDFMLPIGRLDVKGKEIYRGDIVKTKDGKLFEVVYNKEYARYQLGNKRTIMPLDELEVVGNIYENKELLK